MSGVEPQAGRRLLVADDEAPQRELLAGILARAGFEVDTAEHGGRALELLERGRYDLVLTDQKMPQTDGLELLRRVREQADAPPVILMTAFGTVSTAVEAMKRGAADYLTKPFDRDELLLVVNKALRQRHLEDEVATLRGALADRWRLDNIIGASPSMQQVFSLIERVARTDVPVLITGESGTGKELVARAVHRHSSRADGPFVALNCAAVPEHLLESEFFGHERGAFTGAVRSHAGRFEQADGGTLFLDEIGAMRVDLQAKLLRALQEREVQRVGGSAPKKVDVRVVAATCADLEQAIRERGFREDLYYRINVVPIHLPPLRERQADVAPLVRHFLERAAAKFERSVPTLETGVLERLQRHGWPGNVRELENCVERMVVLATGERLVADDLPDAVLNGAAGAAAGSAGVRLPPDGIDLGQLERELIRQALERTGGSLRPAATLLGISYKTLQYRVRKHGLDREAPSAD